MIHQPYEYDSPWFVWLTLLFSVCLAAGLLALG